MRLALPYFAIRSRAPGKRRRAYEVLTNVFVLVVIAALVVGVVSWQRLR
jgi:hypothetical protein